MRAEPYAGPYARPRPDVANPFTTGPLSTPLGGGRSIPLGEDHGLDQE